MARLRPRCRRTSERRRIGERVAAVGCVIGVGVAVAAPVIVVIEAEPEARHEAPAASEIPFVAEGTARLGKVLPRNAASERRAGAAEMAPAKAAAHASAGAKAAHASAAETAYASAAKTAYASATTEPTQVSAADVSAAEPAADVSAATESPTVPTTKTPTMSAPAARKRISGQSRGESGSRGQYDHGLT